MAVAADLDCGCDTPGALSGTTASGYSCSSAQSCAPTCCPCVTTVQAGAFFSAAACVNGNCLDGSDTCTQSRPLAQTLGVCP